MDHAELNNLLKKPGYGIASSFGKGSVKSSFHNAGASPNVEPCVGLEPICEEKTTLNYSGQCVVRVKAYRKRLCDVEGNCYKYHLDFLRYCGAIKDDDVKAIRLVIEDQEKVATEAEERLEIVVEYPDFDFDNPFVTHAKPAGKKRPA